MREDVNSVFRSIFTFVKFPRYSHGLFCDSPLLLTGWMDATNMYFKDSTLGVTNTFYRLCTIVLESVTASVNFICLRK